MAKLCEACNQKFYESLIRNCPKKPGHFICLYCCRKCKWQYRVENTGICGCKAFDEMREKEAEQVDAKQRRKNNP